LRYLFLCIPIIFFSFSSFADELSAPDFSELEFFGFYEEGMDQKARKGLDHLFNGDGFHNGLPLKSAQRAKELQEEWNRKKSGERIIDKNSPLGQFYYLGNIPSPPSRNAPPGLAVHENIFRRHEKGPLLTNGSCLACHTGIVAGKVVAGLANSHIDQMGLWVDAKGLNSLRWILELDLETEEEYFEFNEFMDLIALRLEYNPLDFLHARGDNIGPFAVWANLSRLKNPSELGLEMYGPGEFDLFGELPGGTYYKKLLDEQFLPIIESNPWWLLKYKKSSYWYQDTEAGPTNGNHFAFNFSDPHETANEDRKEHVKVVA